MKFTGCLFWLHTSGEGRVGARGEGGDLLKGVYLLSQGTVTVFQPECPTTPVTYIVLFCYFILKRMYQVR